MMLESLKNIKVSGRFIFRNAPKIVKDVQEIEPPESSSKDTFKIPEKEEDQVFKKFSLNDLSDYVSSSTEGKILNYLA